MSCHGRIERSLGGAVRLPLSRCSRYVVFSDCHRGEGTHSDNFLKNQHLYCAALEYYLKQRFFYIELGDGEELWENRSLQRIKDCHQTVYDLLGRFEKRGQFAKIYGNHDMELRNMLPPAVILENREGGRNIHMLHGHQADFFNSVCWRLSRFLVRYLWNPLELLAVNDPTSAARNYRKTRRYENCLKTWTVKRDTYLLAGHSHRPRLPEEGEWYVNCGSCVHPGGVTCIEVEAMRLTLVRWVMATQENMLLCVKREIINGPTDIM